MTQVRPRMTHLFEQLGLEATEQAIQQFIQDHQLDEPTNIYQASFWSDAQRQFLKEKLQSDGEWALVVDQLNEALHEENR